MTWIVGVVEQYMMGRKIVDLINEILAGICIKSSPKWKLNKQVWKQPQVNENKYKSNYDLPYDIGTNLTGPKLIKFQARLSTNNEKLVDFS